MQSDRNGAGETKRRAIRPPDREPDGDEVVSLCHRLRATCDACDLRKLKLARYFAAGFEAGGNGLGTRLAIAGIVLRYA